MNKVDTQLHETMRIITGTIDSTPLEWLPVLANIAPPEIRRKAALQREWQKMSRDETHPIHQDLINVPNGSRLKSRFPLWKESFFDQTSTYDASADWKRQWNSSNVTNHSLVTDPTKKLAGFDLDRKTWKTINRIRTGHGRTGQMLSRWNNTSPECDCGANSQTMEHIVNVCPLRCFSGGITELHELTSEAVDWLRNIDIEL